MDILFRISSYLRHKLSAGDEHSIHSPFVYSLYTTAIKKNKQFYCFHKIETLRKKAELNKTPIVVEDFGVRSTKKNKNRTIADIAKISSKPPRQSQLLFCLVWYLKPKVILELGTSLGLTTAYLASPDSTATVYSFEGCPEVSSIAGKNFKTLRIKNIVQITGSLEETLEKQTEGLEKVDFVFFDANHRYTPTLNYYKQLLPKVHEGTVFVFDDIYWSKEMKRAWDEIVSYPEVTLSIDLYHIGIIFFRTNAPKQHFNLKIQ